LNYNTKLNKDLTLYANIGGVVTSTDNQYLQRSTNGGFNIRDFFSLTNSKNNPVNSSSSRGSDLLYGIFATAQLSYKEMLFLEASGRNDWSSILPPNNNSYFYPGVSASWLFSQVLQMPAWFNYGKLRASYTNLGLPGPRYFSNNIYSVGSYPTFGATFSPPNSLPPANLVPEKRREIELGIESRFLDSRMGLEVNYYHSNRYRAIIGLSLPASTGVGSININAGDIAQNGFEIQLMATPIKTKDFQWNLNLNGAKDKPMVKKLFPGITQQTLWGATGATIAAIEGHPWGEILLNPYIIDSKTGKKVVDAGGYYDTDPSKQVPYGNVLPNLTGGFNNTFTYKGFSLNFNIDFQFGSKLISQTNMYMIGNGSGINTIQGRDAAHGGLAYYVASDGTFVQTSGTAGPAGSKYDGTVFHDGVILDGVKADGTPNTTVITAADKYSYYWRSFMDLQPDVIYKNDYIKLRNAVIAYEFPKSVAAKLLLQRLSLAFFVNNVAYLHKTMPNVDPEAINGTNNFTENNGFPATRSYGFTVKTTF
jgi:iron complex outermembrane receptor protein